MPKGTCHCGDGNYIRGYCSKHYQAAVKAGEITTKAHRQAGTGTDWFLKDGYLARNVSINGRLVKQYQHRIVMEQALGRKLLPQESVHHRNGERADNRLENLELWSKSQPYGQRVEDKLAWAREIIALYGDEVA